MSEADTCRKYVLPKLQAAGWTDEQLAEQRTFTDGRIVLGQSGPRRKKQKRADYILRYTRDFPIAVIEAKPESASALEGLQQAMDYAEILGLKFAYATNGLEIHEYDYFTGQLTELGRFPSPRDLWVRWQLAEGMTDAERVQCLLTPFNLLSGKTPRYYQELAINRSVQTILQGQKRILLTMATGTGKTVTAFQICWKLWSARWNRAGAPHQRPKILFLADRNVLVDDPKDKTFTPFGDARWKLEGGVVQKGRELYFATYQSLAKDENRPGLYKEYDPEFFDLIIVDECHRGSAKETSSWRAILKHFEPAFQLGLTATPKRDDNVDTYLYFGNPIYTYSLRQGIEDGFLAPYRVHRVISSWDRDGWTPSAEDIERYGRELPEGDFQTKDFDRVIALKKRTEAITQHLTEYLQTTDRFAKTIVFCADEAHALEMKAELMKLNTDLLQQHPDYVCRVTSTEKSIGRGHLNNCQDVERDTPVILTTSQMLTTGVDIPTCKNIVLVRVVNSMTEFKQIIGRGTRVREDYGKLFFSILDYTGSATRLFRDDEFDAEPSRITEEEIEDGGTVKPGSRRTVESHEDDPEEDGPTGIGSLSDDDDPMPNKLYVAGEGGRIVKEMVYDLDAFDNKLRLVKLIDYTGEEIRTMYQSDEEVRRQWAEPEKRREIIERLRDRGINFADLQQAMKQPKADPIDLLCHLAFDAPLLTRRQRAEKVLRDRPDFFDQYGDQARQILNTLLDKYADHGPEELTFPLALKVPPISDYGNVVEISSLFGGPEELLGAVTELQRLLYVA